MNKTGHNKKIREIYCTLTVTISISGHVLEHHSPNRTHIYTVMAGGSLVLIYSSIVSPVKVLQCGRRRKSEISAFSHWQLQQMWKCEKGLFCEWPHLWWECGDYWYVMVRITISSQYPEFWTVHSGYWSYNPYCLGGILEGTSGWHSPAQFVFGRTQWFEVLMSSSIIQN